MEGKQGMTRRLGRVTWSCVSISIVFAACSSGPTRSAASFCGEFEKRAVELRDKYQSAVTQTDPETNALGSLLVLTATVLEAQGDMVSLFDALDQRAPGSIEPDVAAMRDAFQSQSEATRMAVSNPLGALGSGLITGLQTMGSAKRVEAFVQSNCDLSFMQSSSG